ncbi:MAG: sigma-70 family RNA polymerase sigma factor [Acidobacteria bacterium]|nr:sigma-70 family RNA polymerase sigma factor [Acidobacteriota bacterium]
MPRDITQLLRRWHDGDSAALEELAPLVYEELRRIAQFYMQRERSAHTLQRTALVHEAFLRLAKDGDLDWQNRDQFFGVASRLMRRILVDHARRRQAERRGGGQDHEPLEAALRIGKVEELLDVDLALAELAAVDAGLAQLVELRYFGGLELPEIAGMLGVSLSTVKRDWTAAKLWLHHRIQGSI